MMLQRHQKSKKTLVIKGIWNERWKDGIRNTPRRHRCGFGQDNQSKVQTDYLGGSGFKSVLANTDFLKQYDKSDTWTMPFLLGWFFSQAENIAILMLGKVNWCIGLIIGSAKTVPLVWLSKVNIYLYDEMLAKYSLLNWCSYPHAFEKRDTSGQLRL